MACAGDVPTLETLAAVDLLRRHFADIKIRVVNVVDLMTPFAEANTLTDFQTVNLIQYSRRISLSSSLITVIPG